MLKNKDGYNMDSAEILTMFGLKPNSPIPIHYADTKKIDGVWVHIFPRNVSPIKRRVVAECPICTKFVCAGHLHQHLKVHKDVI